jgi:hypothetical protein
LEAAVFLVTGMSARGHQGVALAIEKKERKKKVKTKENHNSSLYRRPSVDRRQGQQGYRTNVRSQHQTMRINDTKRS